MSNDVPTDYPLSAVPHSDRKGLLSTTLVLVGFTLFTATMFAGGKLASGFTFSELLWVVLIGNLLLGIYAAILGYIAYRSGLNTLLMGRFCFGEWGSKLADMILGFTQIGWYSWGVATIAIVLIKILGLPQGWEIPLMVIFGLGFCVTAYIGYRGLEWLSRFAVPAMLIFIVISFIKGGEDLGSWGKLFELTPADPMTLAAGITVVFGTFVSGGTQATNWSRFARSGPIAIWATLGAFFVGNGLMVFTGAFGSLVYQQADVVDVMLAQGFVTLAVLMLFLNLWTTQDNTIYNFAVAGCNLLRTPNRKWVTLAGAAIGTVLAINGMYDMLIPYLILLGTFIPPIGGVIMADFWVRHKGQYPSLESVTLPAFNVQGLAAYVIASAAAYTSPWIAPLVGIVVAVVVYTVMVKLTASSTLTAEASS
ncbi:cytosine permease [Pokkaliibacter plantistimulans]|uniref:Cytosine permease n=1 Tax=Proteobacteria bacterium 228 TaxID=2083153 RepID=A0A2S5KVA8_9PROT|nr:cytosine permease [Pokkaliibacter plantistimulans]PPC78625.1 cytosine permease [Pokkaliibacter plantistimulans]